MTDWTRILKHASPDVRELNADLLHSPKLAQTVPVESPLAAQFEAMWRHLGGPALDTEVRFHPSRMWRFDYCHLATRTAIELEGGAYSRGRHTRGAGFIEDCHKYNAAARLGYTVFRIATGMVQPDTLSEIIEHIQEHTHEHA